MDWMARSLRSVWHPCTQMQHHEQLPLVPLSHGQGAWLYGMQGEPYLDAISSWWVNLLGHAHPRINAAVKDQIDRLEHAMLAGFTHAPVVELSERLSALTGGVLGHCFYASDGASAVEIALKMSVHYWRNTGLPQKQEFVCVSGSYHGETLGALAVTDVPLFRKAYGALLQGVHVVPSPDARPYAGSDNRLIEPAGDPEGEPAGAQKAAEQAAQHLEQLLQRRSNRIAAVILEPLVQCAAGMVMHHSSYVTRVRELCTQHQVHLICDEIAVGCGRTGTFFASEQAGVWPDLMCLSKGISGGYLPLSLVMTREAIYQAFYSPEVQRGFLHSHSYTGNPLACRAALATLDVLESDQVLQRNQRWSQALTVRLAQALAPWLEVDRIRHLRHCGMIWAFDVQVAEAERPAFARRFYAAALQAGVLLRPIGTTVYFMPPYIMNEDETTWLLERTVAALKACSE